VGPRDCLAIDGVVFGVEIPIGLWAGVSVWPAIVAIIHF
jgi:hypothetical protein